MTNPPYDYRELNISNYTDDDVSQLNQWAIWADSELERQHDELTSTKEEVKSVLQLMDNLAEHWGDEGVFRRCRDRLRKLTT